MRRCPKRICTTLLRVRYALAQGSERALGTGACVCMFVLWVLWVCMRVQRECGSDLLCLCLLFASLVSCFLLCFGICHACPVWTRRRQKSNLCQPPGKRRCKWWSREAKKYQSSLRGPTLRLCMLEKSAKKCKGICSLPRSKVDASVRGKERGWEMREGTRKSNHALTSGGVPGARLPTTINCFGAACSLTFSSYRRYQRYSLGW